MGTYKQDVGAGEVWRLGVAGNYFRLKSCPSPVDMTFYRGGIPVSDVNEMDTGFYFRPSGGFDRVDIRSAAAQQITVMVITGDGGYDHFNVDVTSALQAIAVNIAGSASMTVQQAGTVNDLAAVNVGVAATALVAADAARRGLRFTNAGAVDVYIGGAGVTTAAGSIKIGAGQTWVEDQAAPAAWYGIAGTAGQAVKIQEIR